MCFGWSLVLLAPVSCRQRPDSAFCVVLLFDALVLFAKEAPWSPQLTEEMTQALPLLYMLLAGWGQGRLRVGWVADDLRSSCTGSRVGTLTFIRDTHVDDHSVQGWLGPIRCVQGKPSPLSPPLVQALSLARLVGWGTLAVGPAEGLVGERPALNKNAWVFWRPLCTAIFSCTWAHLNCNAETATCVWYISVYVWF